ncbi:MAG: amine oxidase, partial [Actinomycetota bacterium]|nr:amine oxidase [Actinomycetota bacterium]
DGTVLPTSRRARASWNYRMRSCDATADHVMVNYWMNRLQCLDQPVDYVVSLNAGDTIDERERIATMSYEHPVFTHDAVAAQARLSSLNRDRLAFAGAYHGWGFHEDGCVSGVRAASSLGVEWDTGIR